MKSMDIRLGGNPFPTAQQRLQEATSSFSLPIPSPSKLNRASQPQPFQLSTSNPGSNIMELDLAPSAAQQTLNQSRTSSTTGSSPLKRSHSFSASSTATAKGQHSPSNSSGLSLSTPFTPTQFRLTTSASYPLAPLPDNIDHARAQAEKRDTKSSKRGSLQPPVQFHRSFSQPLFPITKDASSVQATSSESGDQEYEFEPIVDDGTKPPYSYAHLIGMAILRSPLKRLTLNQIYTWIMSTFEYYRSEAQPQTNWQNSIRHNLSLNKSFVKEERPKDEPGKGHYWKIVPGCEAAFARGAKGRRPTNPHRNSITNMLPPSNPSQAQLAAAAALTYPTKHGSDDNPIQDPVRQPRESSVSSNDGGQRCRKNSNSSKLPIFEFEARKDSTIKGAVPLQLQDSPVIPSMDTPPPSQESKGNRKRKSLRDSDCFDTFKGAEMKVARDNSKIAHTDDDIPPSSPSTNEVTSKRPRLEEALSESRIIPKPAPHSFHNLSIISPPPSSSPQRPLSSCQIIFTTPQAQITRRVQDEPPSTFSPQTRLQLHREDINRYLSSPAKSVILESSFEDPYLDLENTPAKYHFHDNDDVVLRYAYGSPAKRETKRRNYWRRLHSGFDPADIDGEGDATEVYGVDLNYLYRASLKNETEKAEEKVEEDDDEDYFDEQDDESETSSDTEDEAILGSPEWDKENEQAFDALSPT